ncbi:MAG: HEAT repeat domain-containing protein [Bacteroidota bacterium]|jgi:HEAT repeat protein
MSHEETKTNFLEVFKIISVFISTVVIAIASLMVTQSFNKSQVEISRSKEVVELAKNLSSQDKQTRIVSAVMLANYGERAIPVLVAALTDTDINMLTAAELSLKVIGEPAERYVENAYLNAKNPFLSVSRATYLHALGMMHAGCAFDLASKAINDSSEAWNVRTDAAKVLGLLMDKRAIPILEKIIDKDRVVWDPVREQAIYSLGTFRAKESVRYILPYIHAHYDPVRRSAVWALGRLGDPTLIDSLTLIANNDKNAVVKAEALNAMDYLNVEK